MLDVLIAVILGIVEGITEWLPISSTGHMILVEQFLHMSTSHEFNSMFRVVIQLGAIMAVVVLYFNKLNPFSKRKSAIPFFTVISTLQLTAILKYFFFISTAAPILKTKKMPFLKSS